MCTMMPSHMSLHDLHLVRLAHLDYYLPLPLSPPSPLSTFFPVFRYPYKVIPQIIPRMAPMSDIVHSISLAQSFRLKARDLSPLSDIKKYVGEG